MGILLGGCFRSPGPALLKTCPVPKICAMQLAPDGHRLALGTDQGEVRLFDENGQTLTNPPQAEGRLGSMAFRGQRFAYCGLQAPVVHLWDLGSNREVAKWPVGDLGKAAERIEHNAIVWVDSRTGHTSNKSYAYVGGREAGEITDISWLTEQRLLVNDLRGRLSWWDPPQTQPAGSLPHPNPVGRYGYDRAASSPDGSKVAVNRFGSMALELYSLPDGRRLMSETGLENLSALRFSPDGAKLACAATNKVRLYSASLGVAESEWEGAARKLTFSSDGRWLMAASSSSRVWDLSTQKEVLKIGDCSDLIPLGSRPLAVALFAHGTTVFDLTTGKPSAEIPGDFRMAAASLDGKRLYLASGDRVEIWTIP